nr:thioredoxin family protein [Anaerolineae bacterium]
MEKPVTVPIHKYIDQIETYYSAYEAYQPDLETLARLHEALPAAYILTPSRAGCPDCVRNVPRMARIIEHLPGWSCEVFDSTSNPDLRANLNITRIPTFIIYDQKGGAELGRIVENPVSGSLEVDLVNIVNGLST